MRELSINNQSTRPLQLKKLPRFYAAIQTFLVETHSYLSYLAHPDTILDSIAPLICYTISLNKYYFVTISHKVNSPFQCYREGASLKLLNKSKPESKAGKKLIKLTAHKSFKSLNDKHQTSATISVQTSSSGPFLRCPEISSSLLWVFDFNSRRITWGFSNFIYTERYMFRK